MPTPELVPLDAILAKLVDPALELDAKRAAVNDLIAHRNDPAAAAMLDELVAASAESPTLWLLARAYGYMGNRDRVAALAPLLDHADVQVKINAFKSLVMLDRAKAIEEARRLVVRDKVGLGLEIAVIVLERCGEEGRAEIRRWMFCEEAPLRVASIVGLVPLPDDEFVERTCEMLRRERKKSVVKVLRKQLVSRVGKDQAQALRTLRDELMFKLENVQAALRQLSPVPDPDSFVRTPEGIARLLGVDPSELAKYHALKFPGGIDEAAASMGNAVLAERPAPAPDLDARFSHDGMMVVDDAPPPGPPAAAPEPEAPPAPPAPRDPPSRFQRTLDRLMRPIFKPSGRRGPDRRQSDGGGYEGVDRRATDRRARGPGASAGSSVAAVALAVTVALALIQFGGGPVVQPAAPSPVAVADSPLGNVGASVDVAGQITAIDAAHEVLTLKLEQGAIMDVHAPGGKAALFAPGDSVKVLGVIRQIRPDARVLVLAFTIAKA